jgi:hypothetical protein
VPDAPGKPGSGLTFDVNPVAAQACTSWLSRSLNKTLGLGVNDPSVVQPGAFVWTSTELQCEYQAGVDASVVFAQPAVGSLDPDSVTGLYIKNILALDPACVSVSCAERSEQMAALISQACGNVSYVQRAVVLPNYCPGSIPDSPASTSCARNSTHIASIVCPAAADLTVVPFNYTGLCSQGPMLQAFLPAILDYCATFEKTNGPYLCTSKDHRPAADVVNLAFAAGSAFTIFFSAALKLLHDRCNLPADSEAADTAAVAATAEMGSLPSSP